MVQSRTPSSQAVPEQACQCSVLRVGTIGPASAAAPAAADVLAAGPGDVAEAGPVAVQAVTASSAAAPKASAAVTRRVRRPSRGGIDMPPIMP